ncbi:MAG TPA: hypothetical protein VFL60_11165 [Gaiellaceae bacterium]|nr:hypothetical protein [Gaiellaceae bacterium]
MRTASLGLAAVCAAAAAAAAAPTRAAAAPSGGSLCSVARGVAADIVHSTSFASNRVTPTKLRIVYTKVVAAEPALRSAASGGIKADLTPVLGWINVLVGDLKKAGWQTSRMLPYYHSLATGAERITPQITALRTYFRSTCKLPV